MNRFFFILLVILFSCKKEDKILDKYLRFNGSNKYLEIKYPYGTTDFSYELWIKTENRIDLNSKSFVNGNQFVIYPLSRNDVNNTGLSYGSNGLKIIHRSIKTQNIIFTLNEELGSNWNHVAVVYEGNNLSLFINGNIKADKVKFEGKPFYLFNIGGNCCQNISFDGEIDEFRMWDYPLNKQDINGRMNFELKGREKGLLIYHSFNNINNISMILDDSGNLRHSLPRFEDDVFGVEINKNLARDY